MPNIHFRFHLRDELDFRLGDSLNASILASLHLNLPRSLRFYFYNSLCATLRDGLGVSVNEVLIK